MDRLKRSQVYASKDVFSLFQHMPLLSFRLPHGCAASKDGDMFGRLRQQCMPSSLFEGDLHDWQAIALLRR